MNNKQLHLMNNLNPVVNSFIDKGKSIISSDLSIVPSKNKTVTTIDLLQRLQEMEEINVNLKKQVEDQSKKLEEVIASNAKFLSIIAHDLRSPFGSIIGVLELLKDSYGEYNIKEVERYIRMATNSANGTLTLLNNLLSWTAAQNKAMCFTPVKINLLELIIAELESVNTSATRKQISLNHACPGNIYLFADLQMVKTIFRNLISNAIKYSFIGGEITVSTSEGKQFAQITVHDNGIGISHKAQKELFKKNEIHSTRGTDNENGTGLGLILCKDFVEKHSGTLSIESERGKGSKFNFTLPNYSN
jgi:signal transduction histidine kinase